MIRVAVLGNGLSSSGTDWEMFRMHPRIVPCEELEEGGAFTQQFLSLLGGGLPLGIKTTPPTPMLHLSAGSP